LVRETQVSYETMNETVTLPNRYPVTLNVPRVLYEWLQQRADQAQHTVEDELLEVVATVLPVNDELPAELKEAISPLPLLENEALWRAARSHLATEFASKLEHLHCKRQREGLTASETQTLSRLVQHYERAMLVRAQAARILKERGHDVSTLLTPHWVDAGWTRNGSGAESQSSIVGGSTASLGCGGVASAG
jgi:hypothetical protein